MAPYVSQAKLLALHLEEFGKAILTGTIDSLQGREAKYAIVSLTTDNIGGGRGVWFALNPHRLVVALTRAKEKTIVVGNPSLLSAKPQDLAGLVSMNVLAAIMNRTDESA